MVDFPGSSAAATRWLLAVIIAGWCGTPASECGAASIPTATPVIEVAITVDDLPSHGEDIPGLSRLQIHKWMLDAFSKHDVRQVYGFLCASYLAGHEEDVAAVRAWVEAGHPLGSHTFSHPRLSNVGVDRYLADIDLNEEPLRRLTGSEEHVWRVFRYPFQIEGVDESSRLRIRSHLLERGYRIAPVTIDFRDWSFNDEYIEALGRADREAISELEVRYLTTSIQALRASDLAARWVFGRPIKHVLLLHVGAFPAAMTDSLLDTWEREGVRFVTLDEALSDPVHGSTTLDAVELVRDFHRARIAIQRSQSKKKPEARARSTRVTSARKSLAELAMDGRCSLCGTTSGR